MADSWLSLAVTHETHPSKASPLGRPPPRPKPANPAATAIARLEVLRRGCFASVDEFAMALSVGVFAGRAAAPLALNGLVSLGPAFAVLVAQLSVDG